MEEHASFVCTVSGDKFCQVQYRRKNIYLSLQLCVCSVEILAVPHVFEWSDGVFWQRTENLEPLRTAGKMKQFWIMAAILILLFSRKVPKGSYSGKKHWHGC